eukprot:Gb_22161 [translate_table: standard]
MADPNTQFFQARAMEHPQEQVVHKKAHPVKTTGVKWIKEWLGAEESNFCRDILGLTWMYSIGRCDLQGSYCCQITSSLMCCKENHPIVFSASVFLSARFVCSRAILHLGTVVVCLILFQMHSRQSLHCNNWPCEEFQQRVALLLAVGFLFLIRSSLCNIVVDLTISVTIEAPNKSIYSLATTPPPWYQQCVCSHHFLRTAMKECWPEACVYNSNDSCATWQLPAKRRFQQMYGDSMRFQQVYGRFDKKPARFQADARNIQSFQH